MALNVEFDFIRREIVVGGLAGSWFVHLSAALVSGLFFSTALTLIMVPVMVTAPAVIKASLGRLGARIGGAWRSIRGGGRGRKMVTPEGIVLEEGPDSARRYMTTDGTGV